MDPNKIMQRAHDLIYDALLNLDELVLIPAKSPGNVKVVAEVRAILEAADGVLSKALGEV